MRNSPPSSEMVVWPVSSMRIWALRRYTPVFGLKTRPVMVPDPELAVEAPADVACACNVMQGARRNDAPKSATTVMRFMTGSRRIAEMRLVFDYNRREEPVAQRHLSARAGQKRGRDVMLGCNDLNASAPQGQAGVDNDTAGRSGFVALWL